MKYIKLRQSVFGDYDVIDASDRQFRVLGIFLGNDVYFAFGLNFLAILRDPLQTVSGGNVTSLFKEGEFVEIYDALQDDYTEEYCCVIKRSELIKLLEQWQELMKSKPEIIMITEENGVFAMHGCSDA